jgi:hypothetical protein
MRSARFVRGAAATVVGGGAFVRTSWATPAEQQPPPPPAPAKPSNPFSWLGSNAAPPSPPARDPTGRQVLGAMTSTFALVQGGAGQGARADALPVGTLVPAMRSVVQFFPLVFPRRNLFTRHIMRTVERHIDALAAGSRTAAGPLLALEDQGVLFTRGGPGLHASGAVRAVAEAGALGKPPSDTEAAVLDVRDVAEWELARTTHLSARELARDRRSTLHALIWCMHLLTFMLCFCEVMLGREGAAKATPNHAAREAYAKAFRPHHSLWQASMARTGLAFVSNSRPGLLAALGWASEADAEADIESVAAALRPVVACLNAFVAELEN